MEISVTEAKAKLTALVRQARAGDQIILTHHGNPVAEIKAVPQKQQAEISAWHMDLSERAKIAASEGPCATESADFLYDDAGLPL